MIGTTVGTYRILERVGQGGMGVVYRAVDQMLEREVAVKVLNRDVSREPKTVERFRSEAVTLARLNHPNIATLYSLFVDQNDLFMVMEFLDGESLEARIRRSGALRLEEGLAVACQALEGVHHAHEFGIIHRDLKPSNLMITSGGLVKVMDFGIARALGSARLTQEGRLVGTIEYISPEQIKGYEADRRSDTYSMGVVLYETLTGQLPFRSTSEFELMRAHIELPPIPPTSLNPQLPGEMEAILLRALAKDPAERFPSAGDFRVALLPVLERCARSTGRPTTGDLPRLMLTPSERRVSPPEAGQPHPLAPLSHQTRMATDESTGEHFVQETRLYQEPEDQSRSGGLQGWPIQQWLSRFWWTAPLAVGFVVLAVLVVLLWPGDNGGETQRKQDVPITPAQEGAPTPAKAQTPPSSPAKEPEPVNYENLPGVLPSQPVETPRPAPKESSRTPRVAQRGGAQPTEQVSPTAKPPASSSPAEPTAPTGGQGQTKTGGGSNAENPAPKEKAGSGSAKAGEEKKDQQEEDARSLLRRHLGKDKKKP